MERKTNQNPALKALLTKIKRLETQKKRILNPPIHWDGDKLEKINDAYREKKYALKEEFAAIGYKFNILTFEITKLA